MKAGDQVEIYSGPNVVDSSGEPFWFPGVITSGPATLNNGQRGYTTLGIGPAAYPFDQTCHLANDLRLATVQRDDLAARYAAFKHWAYPRG
jgi:hypothetical protein